jgi:anti-sigma factor RsiW
MMEAAMASGSDSNEHTMNEHPHDALPAFVLGALDTAEATVVSAHLGTCPECRAEAESFRAVVGMLPYAPAPQEPPAHVKRQLFARISADAVPTGAVGDMPRLRSLPRWMGAVTTLSLAISLVLMLVALETRSRIDRQHEMMTLMAMQGTIAQRLKAAPGVHGASATMYMRPGHNQAVLVVYGLKPPAPTSTYQCWLSSPRGPMLAGTFTVDRNGAAEMLINAPQPIDTYTEVMVTAAQPATGQPSAEAVVLSAPLTDSSE